VATTLSIGHLEVTRDDDRVEIVMRGPLSLEVTRPLLEYLNQVRRESGHCFVLADVSQLTELPPETRRHVSEWHKTHTLDGLVVSGGSFATRALVTLMHNAMRLLGKRDLDLEFAPDEASARRWLDAHRSRVLASPANGRIGG
jgi:hypothetical protein